MTVRLPAGLDPFTGGGRTVEVEGATVAAVVAALDEHLPGLSRHVLDGRGRLRPHLLCMVDGELCRDLDRPVGDELRLVTAVSGG